MATRGRQPERYWRTASDIHLLSQMHREQARIYRRAQRSIVQRITNARRNNPDDWTLSESDNAELSKINTFLARATQSILDLDDAREKLRASADTDILIAQLRHEFVAAAKTFTDDELTILARNLPIVSWEVLVHERRKFEAA